MKVTIIQHVPFETPGYFLEIFESYSAHISILNIFRDPVPKDLSFDVLLVMGGPMNIYQETEYPWLIREKEIIKQAIENGKLIIGVCLGAQLIADVLGSEIYKARSREIGWFPVQKTNDKILNFLPDFMTVFHWHGETFDLPKNSIAFYGSDVTENQAFIFDDRVLALQFHLEMEREGAKALCKNCADEMDGSEFVMEEENILQNFDKYKDSNNRVLRHLVSWLFQKNRLV